MTITKFIQRTGAGIQPNQHKHTTRSDNIDTEVIGKTDSTVADSNRLDKRLTPTDSITNGSDNDDNTITTDTNSVMCSSMRASCSTTKRLQSGNKMHTATANTDKRNNKTIETATANGLLKHKRMCLREKNWEFMENDDSRRSTRDIPLVYTSTNKPATTSDNNTEIDSTDTCLISQSENKENDEHEPTKKRTEPPGHGEEGRDENEITTDEAFEEGQPEDVDSNRTWPVP